MNIHIVYVLLSYTYPLLLLHKLYPKNPKNKIQHQLDSHCGTEMESHPTSVGKGE